MSRGLGDPAQALRCSRAVARALSVDLSELMHTGGLTAAEYARMITRCRSCADPSACEAWIAENGSGAPQPPAHCENAEMLARLTQLLR